MQAKSTQEFYRLESKAYSCSVLCGFVHVQTLNYFLYLRLFELKKGSKTCVRAQHEPMTQTRQHDWASKLGIKLLKCGKEI